MQSKLLAKKVVAGISLTELNDMIKKFNEESGSEFYLGGSYGQQELWAKDKDGKEHRIESGSKEDIKKALIKNRYNPKYTSENKVEAHNFTHTRPSVPVIEATADQIEKQGVTRIQKDAMLQVYENVADAMGKRLKQPENVIALAILEELRFRDWTVKPESNITPDNFTAYRPAKTASKVTAEKDYSTETEYIRRDLMKGKSLKAAVRSFLKKFKGQDNFLLGDTNYDEKQLEEEVLKSIALDTIQRASQLKEGMGHYAIKGKAQQFNIPEETLKASVKKYLPEGENANGILNDIPSKVTASDTPLHSFTNDDEGMKASIYKNTGNALKGQFNVVFSDIDSGKTAGIKTFPKEEDAVAYAKKLTKQKVTASDTDKFDPKLNSGELTDKGKPEEQKDLAKMLFAQIYIMHDGRLDPVEQKYFDDKKALTTYCEEKKLEYEVLDNPNKDVQKKIDAISKKDSRNLVQSVIAIESAMGKVTATTLTAKTVMPFYRSLVNNAKHLYWQVHNIGYGQPQTKILAGSRNAHQELLKIETMLLTMSKSAEGRAKISINNMFKDIKAIKNFMTGGLI